MKRFWRRRPARSLGSPEAREAGRETSEALASARAQDPEILDLGEKLRVIREQNHLAQMIRNAIVGGSG